MSAAQKPDPPLATGELIQAIANNRDSGALALLYEEYAGRVKSFHLLGGFPDTRAEELTVATFVRVWRRAATFSGHNGSPQAWLYTMARDVRSEARWAAADDRDRARARAVLSAIPRRGR